MKLEQSFTVDAPVERVWAALIDVERIAPCLPGAEVMGVDDTGAYQGTFTVKLGPTTAAYRGTLRLEAADEAARTATMSAKGTDKRGQGGASATIVTTMREDTGATHVDVLTDFHITGRLARFGRSGMIEDISKRLMRDFAQCLQATIEAGGSRPSVASAGAAAVVAPEPADPADGPTAPAASAGVGSVDEPDPADAAVASAAGAAAEAASAGAAPPGAEKLAAGPAAPAPEPPASPPPLVGRPVDRSATDAEPEPPAEPARTGWLSDWPDGGTADEAAASAGGVPAAEPPAPESLSPARAEPLAPQPSSPESLSPPRAEAAAAPPPLTGTPSPPAETAPAAAEPAHAPTEQAPVRTAAAQPEEAPVRTESIPPPGLPDPPVPPAAKAGGGRSSFFAALGGRITRLFRREKT